MTISFATSPAKKAGVRSPLVGPVTLLEMSSYDIVSNSNFTISMLPGEVSVGRILPNDLKSCAWPLLKAMFAQGQGSTARSIQQRCNQEGQTNKSKTKPLCDMHIAFRIGLCTASATKFILRSPHNLGGINTSESIG